MYVAWHLITKPLIESDEFVPAVNHVPVACGYLLFDSGSAGLSVHGSSQKKLVDRFFHHHVAQHRRIVGWNSKGFGAAVMLGTALRSGVSARKWYTGEYDQRYSNQHIDVGGWCRWNVNGGVGVSLAAVAKRMELPDRVPTDELIEAVDQRDRETLQRSLAIDCYNIAAIFLRVAKLTGVWAVTDIDDTIAAVEELRPEETKAKK